MLSRIDNIGPGAEYRHSPATGRQGGPVCGAVDTECEPAGNAETGLDEMRGKTTC